MSSPEAQRAINRGAAIVIPFVLVGIAGYSTWVVISEVSVKYLMSPSQEWKQLSIQPRPGAAIAVIILYFVLFSLWLLPYIRTIQAMWTNPGLVPLGPLEDDQEKGTAVRTSPKDMYICALGGNLQPRFCTFCQNLKPDRTHHCSEINRCVRRMDHFCPWVGGVVSETNMKFFMQFCYYATVFCAFTGILLAVLIAERRRVIGSVDVNWAIILGISALFGLFTAGMTGNTVWLTSQNLTTIENLNKANAYYIAVRRSFGSAPNRSQQRPDSSRSGNQSDHYGDYTMLQTQPGENPFDLGSSVANLKSVLGENPWDWLLPIRSSPCTNHDSIESEYKFGPVVYQLRREAGLLPNESETRGTRQRKS